MSTGCFPYEADRCTFGTYLLYVELIQYQKPESVNSHGPDAKLDSLSA